MKNLSVLAVTLAPLYLASCVFLFSLSHRALFHSFSKVAEDLFSIPPFLEERLAEVMEGRDISVSSFLPAQNNLLRVLCDQQKRCPHDPEIVTLAGQALCKQWAMVKEMNCNGWHDSAF